MHAVLGVGAADRRRALGAQRDRAPAAVVEGVHLLLDDVRRRADAAGEDVGVLEGRRLDAAVAGAAEDPLGDLLQRGARVGVGRQHVVRAARDLQSLAHLKSASCVRKGFDARSRPSVVMPMWPG